MKKLSILLIFSLLLNFIIIPPQVTFAVPVSKFVGLDGNYGKAVDNIADTGAKIIGGSTYNLAKSMYDVATDTIDVLTNSNYSSTQRAATWVKIASNAAGTIAIIVTIATAGAPIPIVAGITALVGIINTLADTIKNGGNIMSWLKHYIGNPLKNLLDVFKPNIYIYSDQDIRVNVKISPYDYITKSIPKYNKDKGWIATIKDGSLNGKEDYLFYEARVPDKYFQREEGFIIHSNNWEKEFTQILKEYNFSQKEIKDFIEYWTVKLEPGEYIFYPQYNEQLKNIMPITVSPNPNQIFRLWFLIEKSNNKNIPLPVVDKKIIRKTYYLVEWGGIIDNQLIDEKSVLK